MKAAICSQCGASIDVDETKEAGICPQCGTAFITEKAINNYNVEHMHIDSANIKVEDNDLVIDLKNFDYYLKKNDMTHCDKLSSEFRKKYPYSEKTYEARIISLTKNYKIIDELWKLNEVKECQKEYNKLCKSKTKVDILNKKLDLLYKEAETPLNNLENYINKKYRKTKLTFKTFNWAFALILIIEVILLLIFRNEVSKNILLASLAIGVIYVFPAMIISYKLENYIDNSRNKYKDSFPIKKIENIDELVKNKKTTNKK